MSNSGRYFESLDPVAREQYKQKISLLNLTGDNGPYSHKASKNSVQHVTWVWPAVEFELILLLNR